MKAIGFYEHAGPEVLQLEDIDQPESGPGQVRIASNPNAWKRTVTSAVFTAALYL